ncbi:MAG: L,D-transpeptidase family protein [Clostridia bacterium]|jgi:lipoprotein-anchoring transpeptidase ErfK/SrfK|nr:L,D-transpeptidase family protein [Clostridia bacterium]
MREKLANLSISTKIILILLIITVIMAGTLGIAFATHTDFKKLIKSEETAKAISIPNVTKENTEIEISNAEENEGSVIITAKSKLENYKLYYYIEPIKSEEDMLLEQSQNIESLKPEEKIEDKNYTVYENNIEIFSNAKVYLKYESQGKYSDNAYIIELNNITELIGNEALENEMATEEELEEARVKEKDNSAKYYVIVNYSSNVVTVYEKDAEGNYTVPVKAMVCSTGSATPRGGVYKLTRSRYRWRALFGNVYGQYAVPIVGNILFHSVPYTTNGDPSSLEYWEYDKLGTTASAGCIRLTVADAIWIYSNCGTGTQVEFSASAANPLGKPSARKISGYTDLRGYDPTDPISSNPWNNVIIEEPKDTPAPSESTQPTQSVEPSQTTTPSQSPEPTTDPNPTQTTNPDPTQSTEPSQTTTPSQSPDPTTDPNPSETPSPTTPVNPGEGDSEGNLENE